MNDFQTPKPRKLYRSRRDRVIAGVCGGIAEYYDFSPWGMRLLFIAVAMIPIVTFPVMLILYIALALTLKVAPETSILSGDYKQPDGEPMTSRAEELRRIHQRYQLLEERLQRMESIVTSPGFEFDDELRKS
ncbi:PspC domain-containing protein [bacterium]|nr:PspC domain-containing protein [bacterium]